MKKLDTFFKSKTGLILFAIFSLLFLNGLYAVSRSQPDKALADKPNTNKETLSKTTQEEIRESIKFRYGASLSPYEQLKVQEFKKQLPYAGKNISILFSASVNQFLIVLKDDSSATQTEITETLKKYNMLSIYVSYPALFNAGIGNTNTILAKAERALDTHTDRILKQQDVKGLEVSAQESPHQGTTLDDAEIPDQRDVKALGDFVNKMLMGIPDATPAPNVTFGPAAGGGGQSGGNNPPGSPNTGAATVNDCPDLPKVTVPGAQIHYLESRANCIKPTIIVIHWSGGWGTAEGTANTLNQRGLRCHLGTDADKQLQYVDFYADQVERGACNWGHSNFSIDNEISGVYFDEVFNNPLNENYSDLQAKTQRALASTCWAMKQYNIPADQIFGHFELPDNDEKSDPGEAYINYFRGLARQQCR